ncbi:ABC transporter permease [Arthrobacter sp. Marseille-P9274]|uniref:ABC transporter permease n=1 Tax=Arthrobacter sp. Marseille-P9274 TaxID=2866572 RepID=UPI0021C8A4A2|nr:ABC transporter permease [Arthrobacter sp. Marseille-P9274]
MSTATMNRPAARVSGKGVSFARVLHSEWIKFTTLRSTWILLATTVAVSIGIGVLGAWGMGSGIEQLRADGQDPASVGLDPSMIPMMATGGLDFGQLIIGALGVLLIASEYSTGMIRSTMTAVPRRIPALAAKAVVVAVVAAIVGVVSSFATYFVSQPVLSQYGLEYGLDVENLVQSVLLSGVYLALVALMGLALGSLLRNSAGGIVTLVALLLVLPIVASMLQFDWVKDGVEPFLPSNAGRQLVALQIPEDALTQLQGGLVMAAWAAVLLVAAAFTTKTRDV